MSASASASTRRAVVWLDHRQADVVPVDAASTAPQRVRAHEHPTPQHGSEVRSEHEFFGEVCDHLNAYDAVLVTGGKTALADLKHYAQKHRPHVGARIVGYEVVDHPTENQLRALGRRFFQA